MFSKVLIANRGEVALRIHLTCEKLGIESIFVHNYADRRSPHANTSHKSVLLVEHGTSGYLDAKQIIEAAIKTGAQAIHPGYGFLAESADFAANCEAAGITFIGPNAKVISQLGEKISARQCAIQAGIPVLPALTVPENGEIDLNLVSAELGYPLLIKPAAGGGGKGLHIARDEKELDQLLPRARREAKSAFGDDTLYLEKYLPHARHIEFQVIGDQHNNYLHLGERECSLQRRHQKVVEEAPSKILGTAQRERMGNAALELASSIQYQNLGTIEFLVNGDSLNDFYFMEMNTRLQVEHRVTEMITGLDLVEVQLRIANGEKLKDIVPSVKFEGHAIEARIYAEEPSNDFLPTNGVIGALGINNSQNTITDSALSIGAIISTSFDPMLAKVSCWGKDRNSALQNLIATLRQTIVLGVATNIDFLIEILGSKEVRDSAYYTSYLESLVIESKVPTSQVFETFAAVATAPTKQGKFFDSWRLRGLPNASYSGFINNQRFTVDIPVDSPLTVSSFYGNHEWWIHNPTIGTWVMKEIGGRAASNDLGSAEIISPMPGVVVILEREVGEEVEIGDPLLTVEAMKMELVVRAKQSGQISRIHVSVGSIVKVGQVLMEVSAHV
jgi:acetyl-CoA/propionyl-CoA carboxylase biotin carboxyl carrier protein